jgi:hypothetical protein
LGGCSVSTPGDSINKSGVIDSVNRSLSIQDCGSALQQIQPVYQSSQSDNDIRIATASVYGCFAGIQVLPLIQDLIDFPGDIGGSGIWEFLAKEFPSTTTPSDDKKPQAAMNGLDALFAALKPGIVLIPSTLVNSGTSNPGSILATDRIDDSNSYLPFMSMALIGTLQNRYGKSDSSYHQTVDLPWTTADQTKGDGCAFASALLSLQDGIKFVSASAPSNVATTYGKINTFLSTALDAACNVGCTIICGGSVTCTTCPTNLRDRNSCTGTNTDANSCATAGIIKFVNTSWQGP